MFELDMRALRQTAKQPWLTVANVANLANPIATASKSGWLTLANVANLANPIATASKSGWLTVANVANLANPIATASKSGWLTVANVANAGEKLAPTQSPLATLASVSQRQFDAVAIEKPQISQISQISHDLLTVRLMAAAMRRCDHFNDSEVAREAMRQDVLATPLHLQQDLLDYFNEVNQEKKP